MQNVLSGKRILFAALLAPLCFTGSIASAADDEVRTIRFVQDDAQKRIVSKMYELKHLQAADIKPFIDVAVKRHQTQAKVDAVNFAGKKQQYLVVSAAEELIPYVDDMIAKLDRPAKALPDGSIIDGTGIVKVAYSPNYRASEDMAVFIDQIVGSAIGAAYLHKGSNTIYWKDDISNSAGNLQWIKLFDRPIPQVNLKLNYYEVRESKLRDIGVDYLAWSNGPGLNIFEVGYDAGRIVSDETILQLISGTTELADIAGRFSTSWGYGGFMTAPQFDLSFIRLLQQSGDAKLVANADLTFVNTPISNVPKVYGIALTPEYQNITKDEDDRTDVVPGGTADISFQVINPVICFNASAEETDALGIIPHDLDFYNKNKANLLFSYNMGQASVLERNNRGDELGNSSVMTGSVTMDLNQEKLLASYEKENDVEQTIGVPFLSQIPILKYLFGTTTTIKERTYIIVTAEAVLVHPESAPAERLAKFSVTETQPSPAEEK